MTEGRQALSEPDHQLLLLLLLLLRMLAKLLLLLLTTTATATSLVKLPPHLNVALSLSVCSLAPSRRLPQKKSSPPHANIQFSITSVSAASMSETQEVVPTQVAARCATCCFIRADTHGQDAGERKPRAERKRMEEPPVLVPQPNEKEFEAKKAASDAEVRHAY